MGNAVSIIIGYVIGYIAFKSAYGVSRLYDRTEITSFKLDGPDDPRGVS